MLYERRMLQWALQQRPLHGFGRYGRMHRGPGLPEQRLHHCRPFHLRSVRHLLWRGLQHVRGLRALRLWNLHRRRLRHVQGGRRRRLQQHYEQLRGRPLLRPRIRPFLRGLLLRSPAGGLRWWHGNLLQRSAGGRTGRVQQQPLLRHRRAKLREAERLLHGKGLRHRCVSGRARLWMQQQQRLLFRDVRKQRVYLRRLGR